MTPERAQKIKEVLNKRQFGFTVVLEDVHDPHNISAVLRTCDSVGITEIYTINTITPSPTKMGKRSSAGSRKWVEAYAFDSVAECMAQVTAKYDNLYATHLGESAVQLYQLDLTGSVALLFGNERLGLSEELLSYADKNFIIPQMGMAQSLNVSVACAVSLYEGLRQRQAAGLYKQPSIPEAQLNATYDAWMARELE